MKTPAKAIAAIMLMFVILLTAGCVKENQNNPDDTKMVPVSCTVDIQGNAREGLSVISFGSGFSLTSDSTLLYVIENDLPQLLLVTDEDDNVRMLYRNVIHEGESIEINSHTSALAMVTCHPLVAMVGDSDFVSITSIIEHLQTFPAFEAMVNAHITTGGDLFDTNNTQMLRSIQTVLEELLGTEPDTTAGEGRKDADPLPWADYKPLRFEWVNQSQGKFNLSNYSLIPTYYGTITTPEGREERIVLPTVGSYSLIGVTWNLLWRNEDAFYGDCVPVSLTKGTTNTVDLTNLHDVRAVADVGARFVGDLIGTIGFPMPEGLKKEMAELAGTMIANAVANAIAGGDCAMREAAKSIWNDACSYVGGKITEWVATGAITIAATVYKQGWAKKILKIGVDNILKWYSRTEGGTNLSLRIYYYIKYPNDINFCINYNEDNEVGECSDDWVDLGLPSGLFWATRNVGASSPTDYGNYYAWGETSPKSNYDRSNYRYYRSDNNGDGYTKYCNKSAYGYNGFTDGLTTLQAGDDAATANYGGHTPTAADWEELIQYTSSQWVTINGVNGRCFTGRNGNSLFLPAAGNRYDTEIEGAGSYGDYWSSSLFTDYSGNACGGYFDSGSVDVYCAWYGNQRYLGCSVRAVRSAK